MKVLLISTYELGHQPFGLASPAAWLKAAGADVACLDLAVEPFSKELAVVAGLVALYVPMHTATRLVSSLIPQIRQINPRAHLCCYGLYAPANEGYLRRLGVDTILGGEFESGLTALYRRLTSPEDGQVTQPEPIVSLARQQFRRPDRSGLPDLSQYVTLQMADGSRRTVGYTEASRGCRHTCRHCPIVPVYSGRFRIVGRAVVLDDIRQQVAAGARHITFGDPDFLNGPGHALPLVQALHAEFPALTYDVTIKVEHLLKQARHLPLLRDTGCLFVTSAVEAVDDRILALFDKGHTRADFIAVAKLMRKVGLALNPTFVAFTPWTTAQGYLDLLTHIAELELVEHVAPVQYAIRLLVPAGSKLLELPAVRRVVGPLEEAALVHPWLHPDPAMDELYKTVFRLVQDNQKAGGSRAELFERVWRTALATDPAQSGRSLESLSRSLTAEPIPRLSESWY